MDRPTTSPTFAGTPLYIGIDVHLKRWVVSLRSAGLDLKTFSMNPSPEELAKHLQRHYPGARYLSVYEAGYCGYWIHERLTRLGVENLVGKPGRRAHYRPGAPGQVRQARQQEARPRT